MTISSVSDVQFIGRLLKLWSFRVLLLAGLAGMTGGCKFYSFTGTSLSPAVKTLSIQNLIDKSGLGPPNLSQLFTEKARDYFQRNSNLTQIPQMGDLQIEGAITGYTLTPVTVTSAEVAAQTRLTITVQIKYVNMKDETENFDTPFSFFADFPQTSTLQSVEIQLIDQISNQIVLDIFNKTVANW